MRCSIAAVVLLSCQLSQEPHAPRDGALDPVETSVAVLDDAGWGFCGGAWVGPHTVITAEHCASRASIGVDYERRRSLMNQIESDPIRDLSWHDTTYSHAFAPVGFPVAGEKLRIVHHVGGSFLTQETYVVAVDRTWNMARIAFSPPNGVSGSPAYGTDGSIHCIVVARFVAPPYGGWCTIIPSKFGW